jgi:prephenate dehydrogenase
MIETIGVIIGVLGLAGGMIGVWVNLNLKIKELEVKILNIEIEQNTINKRIDKNESNSREDHMNLADKLDEIMKLLTTIATEHQVQKCTYKANGKG